MLKELTAVEAFFYELFTLENIRNRRESGINQHFSQLLMIKRLDLESSLSSPGVSVGNYATCRLLRSHRPHNGRPNYETVAPEFDTV